MLKELLQENPEIMKSFEKYEAMSDEIITRKLLEMFPPETESQVVKVYREAMEHTMTVILAAAMASPKMRMQQAVMGVVKKATDVLSKNKAPEYHIFLAKCMEATAEQTVQVNGILDPILSKATLGGKPL